MSGLTDALGSLYDFALDHGAAFAAKYEGTDCTMRPRQIDRHLEQDSRVNTGGLYVSVRRSEVDNPVRGEEVLIGDDTYMIADDPTGTTWEWSFQLARDY